MAIHTHVSHTLSRAVGVSEVGMAAIAPSARRITSSGCEADSAAAAARTWSGSGSLRLRLKVRVRVRVRVRVPPRAPSSHTVAAPGWSKAVAKSAAFGGG